MPGFLNGVGGLASPWWRADLPSRFLEARELRSHTTAGRLTRFAAVVESIVFMITANAERLAQQAGPPRRVVLAGGMSRSVWLARRLAALLELPVQVLETEASARGVAQLAAPELTATWNAAPLHSWQPRPERALRLRYLRFRTAIDACTRLGSAHRL